MRGTDEASGSLFSYVDLPDHSPLTRIRQRLGADVFRQIFTRVVRSARKPGWFRRRPFTSTPA